jgi:biotin carboxylase
VPGGRGVARLGFVSEKAEFVELCDRLGITFIGPSAEVMRRLGDKIGAKQLAEQVGVPLAPWSGGPVADLAGARARAESIGYPLMVKATAGGGGRGIRLVHSAEQLDEAFERASSEAAKTAGDATVFLEQAIRGGRHVEVQVIADAEGTVWALGTRDCSVQRRNQKVIEESASTALNDEQELLLRAHAADLIRAAGYVNAGTVEFLYEPGKQLAAVWPAVHSEMLGRIADEFDDLHSIERARSVGSVDTIVPAGRLRPYLIEAVRRGMHRTLAAPADVACPPA